MIVVKLCKAGKMTLFSPIQLATILQKNRVDMGMEFIAKISMTTHYLIVYSFGQCESQCESQ